MTEYAALVVADDLTGATDTAHEFAARGYSTVVVSDADPIPPETDVLVVNTDSRTMPPASAATTVAEVVNRHDAALVYKKVDSTMRGNVRSEVEAVSSETDSDLAVVAPAAPRSGRVVAGGYLLVDGTPVDTIDAYRERETPPESAELVAALSDASVPVERVSIPTVARGATAVRDRLDEIARDHDTALVVCDATLDAHLESIADGGTRSAASVVYVGSSGLAEYVATRVGGTERRVLGVVGSTNERTVEQLSAVPDDWVVTLDADHALDAPAEEGRDAADRVSETITENGTAVLASLRETSDVTATYRRGRERHGFGRDAVRDRIGDALAAAVDGIWNRTPPDGLFLTGGTVATRVFERLEVECVSLTGHAVEAGVPIVRLDGGRVESIPVVTKAGGFGERDVIRRSLRQLRCIDP